MGGLRKAEKDSRNTGWKNASFRGYADYMQTEEFKDGLREVIAAAQKGRTALMCAEAVPWRCHRFLLSDALKEKGFKVLHIISKAEPKEHEFTPFLRVKNGELLYPSKGQMGLGI